MSVLFPQFEEFSPFFRLADEINRAGRPGHHHGGTNSRSFAPRFDVKETKDDYELHGELPGAEESNVNIEWTDDVTLTISGHTEKRYESSNAPEVTEVEENGEHYQKPTVEDEAGEASSSKPAEDSTAVTKTSGDKTVSKATNKPRYWITERSFGSFNRTFQFPSRVDHEGVKASLKNGVLNIVVPKAKAKEPRKVAIN